MKRSARPKGINSVAKALWRPPILECIYVALAAVYLTEPWWCWFACSSMKAEGSSDKMTSSKCLWFPCGWVYFLSITLFLWPQTDRLWWRFRCRPWSWSCWDSSWRCPECRNSSFRRSQESLIASCGIGELYWQRLVDQLLHGELFIVIHKVRVSSHPWHYLD